MRARPELTQAVESSATERGLGAGRPAADCAQTIDSRPGSRVGRASDVRELPRLLTLPEVAAFLRVSPKTVRRLVAGRKLRCVRVGRVLRFRQADLFRFVEAVEE